MRDDSPSQTLPAPSIPVVSETQSKSADGSPSCVENDVKPSTENVPDVLFVDDLARLFRRSRSTIERRIKDGSLPIPEMLPMLDNRHRFSRYAVEEYLRTSRGVGARPGVTRQWGARRKA